MAQNVEHKERRKEAGCKRISHTLDEPCVQVGFVFHVHHFDHVQVDGLLAAAHGQHGVRRDVCQKISQLGVHLRKREKTAKRKWDALY